MSVCKDRASIAKRVKLNVVLFFGKERGRHSHDRNSRERERYEEEDNRDKKKKIGKCH